MKAKRSNGLVTAFCLLSAGALLGGCSEPAKRLNAPPQGASAHPHEMQENYVPMTDNALLADMSMSPVHFVPHQPELNGNGVRRLTRYASILKTYGGTLHYDGLDDAEPLAKARIARMEEFLTAAGLERDRFSVALGVAGGAGMRATEAIAARDASSGPDGCNAASAGPAPAASNAQAGGSK